MLRLFLSSLLVILTLAPSFAAVRDHDITLDDYFTQAYTNDCVLSPDGKYVAYSEMRWQGEKEPRNNDIWVANTQTGETRRLTFDKAWDDSPQWSADGNWIYFTSGPELGEDAPIPYDGSVQVWRVPRDGGDPMAVTRVEDGIGSFEISANGKAVYYTVSDEGYEDEFKDLREKHDYITYGHGKNEYTKLIRLDLNSWRTQDIFDSSRYIEDFAISPDESQIALITNPTEQLIHNEGQSSVDILTPASGAIFSLPSNLWRESAPSPYGWLEGLSWSRDGKKLAFRVDFDGYPTELLVAHFDTDETLVTKLTRPNEISLGESSRMLWKGDSHDLYLMAISHARAHVMGIPNVTTRGQGNPVFLTRGDVVAQDFSFSRDGRAFAVLQSDPMNNPEIYFGSELKRITYSNPQMDTWKIPQMSVVKWTAPDGQEVEGILELPPDYKQGDAPLPMHVALHGGPTMCDYLHFEFWIYGRIYWPAQGWAVFSPNYRGSTGYGDKFLTDLIDRENDIEVNDILSGVDAMVERGFADPEKLAISGWSNGGYLTNCVITHTTRFKAASSGAGVLDMMMQWGAEDTPGHVINYMKGLPWEKQDAYLKASPSWNLNKITTPTLIHVGENDPRVPAVHARTLHRALKEYLNVPTELLVYPDQGHGLSTMQYRRAKMEWDAAWFKKYVLGEEASAPARPEQ
jgi:dipeptidyl aminopeptidase/acylaminoacyl peptidase